MALVKDIKSSRRSSKANLLFSTAMYIPLRPRFVKMLEDDPTIVRAGHFTSRMGFQRLERLQGSKKGISTTDKEDYGESYFRTLFDQGVENGGGMLALVSGRRLARFDQDVFSELDLGGMRWISVSHLKHMMHDQKHKKFLGTLHKKFEIARDVEILKIYELLFDTGKIDQNKYLELELIGNKSTRTSLQSMLAKTTMHDLVYTGDRVGNDIMMRYTIRMNKIVEKVLTKFKDLFREILFAPSNEGLTQGSSYHLNEIIINRIKIEHVLLMEDFEHDFKLIKSRVPHTVVGEDDPRQYLEAKWKYENWVKNGRLP